MVDDDRWEKDSLGSVRVPKNALYGAQTQRAVENFPISGMNIPDSLIRALGQIKQTAARVNGSLGLIPEQLAQAIVDAAQKVIDGEVMDQFPVDIFQTGSGTSSNMNANEVIAGLVRRENPDLPIHPNDHVNLGQSSNDVFPTAIRTALYDSSQSLLIPALLDLERALSSRADETKGVVKTGRTHLMDAMPVTFGQVLRGYSRQIELGIRRLEAALERVAELPIGGTAVGTGINTHIEFPTRFIRAFSELTGHPFREAEDHFEAQSSIDALVEFSGQMRTLSVSLMKIANDFRWMNSGPNSGLSEIQLPALQPGSSIMPGKVNPVIEESVAMVCAQVIGYDQAVATAGLSGNFELNVMYPLVAHNLLESIRLLSNAVRNWADKSISRFEIHRKRLKEQADRNPILVTAINRKVGYDKAAQIAKKAFSENRSIQDVAAELTDIPREELEKLLDPVRLTRPGFSTD